MFSSQAFTRVYFPIELGMFSDEYYVLFTFDIIYENSVRSSIKYQSDFTSISFSLVHFQFIWFLRIFASKRCVDDKAFMWLLRFS